MLEIYLSLESIAREFKEVVVGTRLFRLPSGEPAKLRIELVDGSFADASDFCFREIFIPLEPIRDRWDDIPLR